MFEYKDQVKKAVLRSQHCQRNYDLSKKIPEHDKELLIHAATNCPSKQNIRFYNLHVFDDQNIIRRIHELTTGVHAYDKDGNFVPTTNSQTMANLLFVFERREISELSDFGKTKWTDGDKAMVDVYERDLFTSLGIASGYVNLTASMLGYKTGCCQCFEIEELKPYLNIKNDPVLMMGVGYRNDEKSRRQHATNDLVFPTRTKEEIIVTENSAMKRNFMFKEKLENKG
jgi:nitroreductase